MPLNKTKIDWPGLTHTWNPVVGCRHNCYYCYAKKMNDRFKWIDDWQRGCKARKRMDRELKR